MQRLISTSDVGRPRACVRGVSGTRHVGLWLCCVLQARNDRLRGASSPHSTASVYKFIMLRRESETESESADFFTNPSETVRLPDFETVTTLPTGHFAYEKFVYYLDITLPTSQIANLLRLKTMMCNADCNKIAEKTVLQYSGSHICFQVL